MIERVTKFAASFTPRAYLIAALVAAIALALTLSYCAGRSDQRKITKGEVAERSLKGERRANEGEEKRKEARDADSADTKEKMKEAEDADPEAARAPAGPVSRAAADRLRR